MSDRGEHQETDILEKISEVATLMMPPSTKIDEDAHQLNKPGLPTSVVEGESTNLEHN